MRRTGRETVERREENGKAGDDVGQVAAGRSDYSDLPGSPAVACRPNCSDPVTLASSQRTRGEAAGETQPETRPRTHDPMRELTTTDPPARAWTDMRSGAFPAPTIAPYQRPPPCGSRSPTAIRHPANVGVRTIESQAIDHTSTSEINADSSRPSLQIPQPEPSARGDEPCSIPDRHRRSRYTPLGFRRQCDDTRRLPPGIHIADAPNLGPG